MIPEKKLYVVFLEAVVSGGGCGVNAQVQCAQELIYNYEQAEKSLRAFVGAAGGEVRDFFRDARGKIEEGAFVVALSESEVKSVGKQAFVSRIPVPGADGMIFELSALKAPVSDENLSDVQAGVPESIEASP